MHRYRICPSMNTLMNQKTFRQAERREGVTVCDSHREDQLLNPYTISTESLFSDLKALKIYILVM